MANSWLSLTIEEQIEILKNEIIKYQAEIQRLVKENPRCPQCNKRYNKVDYRLFTIVDIDKEKWSRYLCCPHKHKIRVKDSDSAFVDMDKLFAEVEELDYGWSE